MAEPFVMKKAVEISGVTIFKAIKFGLIFLAVAGLCYCVYVTVVQPHTKNKVDTTTENFQQKFEYNYTNPDDAFFVGIRIFGVKFGISKLQKILVREQEKIK